MAELKCTAESCTYNKDRYCCKGDIMVGGKNASRCDETCCESFAQTKGGLSSSTSHPSSIISIDCEAEKCKYNSNYKCTAGHVNIKGVKAMAYRDTACETFCEK